MKGEKMEELFNKELLDFLKKNCKEKDIDIYLELLIKSMIIFSESI